MTAYADLETAIQALRAGAVDFILKPFRSNQLLNAVARCLDRVTLLRETSCCATSCRQHPTIFFCVTS